MSPAATLRRSAALAVTAFPLLCGICGAQTATPGGSSLPVTTQTSVPLVNGGAVQAAPSASRRPSVQLQDGLLTVTAKDSSLNAIVREIARQTGMRVTGAVRDDRVFGTYGPDTPSAILSTLLDGTGTNVLLVNTSGGQPAQLILSPRSGGPTPPSQSASSLGRGGDDEQENGPGFGGQPAFGAPPPPQPSAGNRPGLQPGQNLTPPLSSPTSNNTDSQAVVFPSVNATTTPATATTSSDTTQEAPSGIKTPQQIFEQLQQLRQQQEQTTPGSATPQ